MSKLGIIINGIIKENPTFVLMLGMCPTLATTTSAMNGMMMGLATMAVLICSNICISLIKKITPDMVHIPVYIVVIATLVTIVQFSLAAYLPDVNKQLGLFIPLIVVNCIILGRAESFALFNTPILSFFDGLGMGLGFTFALVTLGAFREILGAGSIFGFQIIPDDFHIGMMVLAPGAFLVLAFLTAIQNKLGLPSATNGGQESNEFVTSGDVFGAYNQSTDAADVKEA